MATKSDLRGYFSKLKSLLRLQQRFAHTVAGGIMQEKVGVEKGSNLCGVPGQHDISTWKMVDARKFGISTSMISQSSWLVLKVLQNEGFEAYLVGGCVRDLILNRTPKDFDVITTADLKQIKCAFNHAFIVGRRFPICLVNLKGSAIEVSSFKKAASHEKEKAEAHSPKRPRGCSEIDYVRWRDCTSRDFTVNSLFYDPFAHKIYDYANAMKDLKSSKLQTLIPAQMSFKEDCARILRGLRIAARLGFSFSKEIKTAIYELSSSIASLPKSRLMMELNYMLAYGAAEPSLSLLRRYKVLEIMLPFHDAYLSNHSGDRASMSSSMLMKLFSSLDKVVTCDKPCDCLLWVGLLAFHLALVTKPQEVLVVRTFASVLYYSNWDEGVKSAREGAFERVDFEPEFLKSFNHLSDKKLEQKVSEFASTVQESINILTDPDSLLKAMARYPSSRCSGSVLIPRRFNLEVGRLFNDMVDDIQSIKSTRRSYEINHQLLREGNIFEIKFVLGKIIMDMLMAGDVTDKSSETVPKHSFSPSDAETPLEPIKKRKLIEKSSATVPKHSFSPSDAETPLEPIKKQKFIEKEQKLVVKRKNTSEKLALSSSKATPKENTVLGEQAEMDPKPIKKQKPKEKEQKKGVQERKLSQSLASSSKKKSEQNKELENQATEETLLKEKQNVRSLSSLFKYASGSWIDDPFS